MTWPAVLLSLTLAAPLMADVVVRRGKEEPLEGKVEIVDESGVVIRTTLGAAQKITWDRVRDVQAPAHRQAVDRFMPMALDLWRARSRVERGDTELAEPLLEHWFNTLRGKTHETALVVAEGLLRCRLARGDQVRAVIPALETARLRRAGEKWTCYSLLEPVIDSATSLCPKLPPTWPESASLSDLIDDLKRYQPSGDDVIAALAELFLSAAMQHEKEATESTPMSDSGVQHPGVVYLKALVGVRSADDHARQQAVDQLRRQLRSEPPWIEAWSRYQLGVALLGDLSSADQRQQGLLHLLHLPARFGRTQPLLAGLALQRVVMELERDGRKEAAQALRQELTEYDGLLSAATAISPRAEPVDAPARR